MPGDKIKMVSSEIYLNNEKLNRELELIMNLIEYFDVIRYKEILQMEEIEIFEMKNQNNFFQTNDFDEVEVPKDSFYVLGDNRDNSQDSRFVGFIPKSNLVGKSRIVFII